MNHNKKVKRSAELVNFVERAGELETILRTRRSAFTAEEWVTICEILKIDRNDVR